MIWFTGQLCNYDKRCCLKQVALSRGMAKRALRVTKINLDELPIELNSEHVESLEDFDFFEFLKIYQTRSHFARYIYICIILIAIYIIFYIFGYREKYTSIDRCKDKNRQENGHLTKGSQADVKLHACTKYHMRWFTFYSSFAAASLYLSVVVELQTQPGIFLRQAFSAFQSDSVWLLKIEITLGSCSINFIDTMTVQYLYVFDPVLALTPYETLVEGGTASVPAYQNMLAGQVSASHYITVYK